MIDKSDIPEFLRSIRPPDDVPDEVDFYWYDDETLLNLAFDYDRVKVLNEDDAYALLWQVSKRYEEILKEQSIY